MSCDGPVASPLKVRHPRSKGLHKSPASRTYEMTKERLWMCLNPPPPRPFPAPPQGAKQSTKQNRAVLEVQLCKKYSTKSTIIALSPSFSFRLHTSLSSACSHELHLLASYSRRCIPAPHICRSPVHGNLPRCRLDPPAGLACTSTFPVCPSRFDIGCTA